MSTSKKPRRERGTGRLWQIGPIWYIQYYVHGRQVRESSGSRDERVATKLLRRRLGEAAAGVLSETRRLTYRDLRSAYMDYYETNKKKSLRWRKDPATGERVACLDTVNRLDAFFDGYRASAIDSDLMVEFTKKLQAEGLAASTINRSLSSLRRMFNLAKKRGKLRDVPYFPMLKEAPPRKGILAHGKYETLRAALSEHAATALALGYHTGMRAGEVRGLRWEQVNLLEGFIRLNAGETKNDEAREIPVGPELTAVLREQQKRAERVRSPWVCFRVTRKGKVVRLGDFRKVWRDRCVKLGLGRMEGERYVGLIFHDLRRTFVTDAEYAGAPRHEVMKITGHKTEAVYKRYAIDNRERRRAALDEIAAYRAARNGESSGKVAEPEATVATVAATIQ